MKKIILLSLVLFLSVFLSGCSWQVSFYVVNESGETIEVEYIFSDKDRQPENPYKTSLENWKSWFSKHENWLSMNTDEFEFDAKTQTYKVKVNPNEVLRFHEHNDSCVTSKASPFHIKRISVKGNHGKITYENGDFFRHLSDNQQIFEIIYK